MYLCSPSGDIFSELSSFQKRRWDELQALRNTFLTKHSEWLSIKDFYSNMSDLAHAPPILKSEDFNKFGELVCFVWFAIFILIPSTPIFSHF